MYVCVGVQPGGGLTEPRKILQESLEGGENDFHFKVLCLKIRTVSAQKLSLNPPPPQKKKEKGNENIFFCLLRTPRACIELFSFLLRQPRSSDVGPGAMSVMSFLE